jgi:hypothetical protein
MATLLDAVGFGRYGEVYWVEAPVYYFASNKCTGGRECPVHDNAKHVGDVVLLFKITTKMLMLFIWQCDFGLRLWDSGWSTGYLR